MGKYMLPYTLNFREKRRVQLENLNFFKMFLLSNEKQ